MKKEFYNEPFAQIFEWAGAVMASVCCLSFRLLLFFVAFCFRVGWGWVYVVLCVYLLYRCSCVSVCFFSCGQWLGPSNLEAPLSGIWGKLSQVSHREQAARLNQITRQIAKHDHHSPNTQLTKRPDHQGTEYLSNTIGRVT